MRGWNRCDYCGRFIGWWEFADKIADKIAERILVTPDSALSTETYETYHVVRKSNEHQPT